MKKITLIFCLQLFFMFDALAIEIGPDEQSFIKKMSEQYGFSSAGLNALFSQATFSEKALTAISRPAERLSWHRYRDIFIKQQRIEQGATFWEQNEITLRRAEKKFGIPAEVIVAIIGIETFYGKYTGGYNVLDALLTLAFNYPKRSDFFRAELEHYLLLTREQGVDPRSLSGSYAGAMGIPQFISSSYRNYAIDFNRDGRIDIWHDVVDAIGSVASYLNVHGWQRGQQAVVAARSNGKQYRSLVGELLPYVDLQKAGVTADATIPEKAKVRLLALDLKEGTELWVGLDNFHVIKRYNHSTLYVMAVCQLASKIKQHRLSSQR